MRKALVSWLMVVVLLASSVAGMAQSGGYFEGFEDGHAAAKEDVNGLAQFAGGLFFGLVYVVVAALTPGQSPTEARLQTLRGRPEDYQRGFLEGYEKEWKRIRSNNGLLGVGTFVVASVVFYMMILASLIHSLQGI